MAKHPPRLCAETRAQLLGLKARQEARLGSPMPFGILRQVVRHSQDWATFQASHKELFK